MKDVIVLVAVMFVIAIIAGVGLYAFGMAFDRGNYEQFGSDHDVSWQPGCFYGDCETDEDTLYIREDGALCREETMECFEDPGHNDGTIDGYNETAPTCGGFICVY